MDFVSLLILFKILPGYACHGCRVFYLLKSSLIPVVKLLEVGGNEVYASCRLN